MIQTFGSLSVFHYIGGAVLSLFYEKLQALTGSAAIHIAVGGVSKGKSIALKLVLAACCNFPNGYQTCLSESMARRFLSGGLPFGYDDPGNDDIVKQMLINSFGGAGMVNEHNQMKASCTPLITANEHVLQQLSLSETRSVLDTYSFKVEPYLMHVGTLYEQLLYPLNSKPLR